MLIDFTEEELYMIERLMDAQYSALDSRCIEVMEKISHAIIMKSYENNQEVLVKANDALMRMFDSALLHRKISEKCEKVRHEHIKKD